jgi:hypothetical protein
MRSRTLSLSVPESVPFIIKMLLTFLLSLVPDKILLSHIPFDVISDDEYNSIYILIEILFR